MSTPTPSKVSVSTVANAVKPETTPVETKPETVTPETPPVTPATETPKSEVTPEPEKVVLSKALDPSKVVAPAVTPDNPQPQEVRWLEDLLNRYRQVNPGILRNDTERTNAINAMVGIVRYVLRNPTQPVLERLFQFFKEHRSTILSETLVMQGIRDQPIAIRSKMEVIYTLFSVATGPDKSKLNYAYAKSVLGEENVVNFIANKIKSR